MAITAGQPSIAMSNVPDQAETLPPSLYPSANRSVQEHIDYLLTKVADLETVVEGKADTGKLRSLIAISDEAILLRANDIVLYSDVTIAQVVAHQNGTQSGQLPLGITRIIGDVVKTGAIESNNWGAAAGSQYDLDNATFTLGGSSSPSFDFDGSTLSLDGDILADSLFCDGDTNNVAHPGLAASIQVNPTTSTTAGVDIEVDGTAYAQRNSTTNGNAGALSCVQGSGGNDAITVIYASSGRANTPVLSLNGVGPEISLAAGIIEGVPEFEDEIKLTEITAPSSTAGFCKLHGGTYAGQTVLGIVCEKTVTTSSGPTFNRYIQVEINGTVYTWWLEA